MHKNAINWRRTWKGSIFELICPALLMLLLVWIRTLIDIEISDPSDVYKDQYPLYPPVALNPTSGQWVLNQNSINSQNARLTDFLKYTNFADARPSTGQVDTTLDPRSPYNFIPPHCVRAMPTNGRNASDGAFNQPLIAVVTEGNDIEQDLIDQLSVLFEAQKAANPDLAKVDMRVK